MSDVHDGRVLMVFVCVAVGISGQQRERWRQEVEVMHRLNHPNIVKAIKVPSCLESHQGDLPALGMEVPRP